MLAESNIAVPIISLVVAIVCMVVCGNLFAKKGYSKVVGYLVGFFLSIIGVIIAFVLPSKNTTSSMR